MKRAPYGTATADRVTARGAQRYCKCGEPIAGNKKKYCWECEGALVDARTKAKKLNDKRKRNGSRNRPDSSDHRTRSSDRLSQSKEGGVV